jgi:DNA-binding NtrC family response regulator
MTSVLIVDDEPLVRNVLLELLTEPEFRTIEAETASQALKFLREAGPKISVLVTDVRMPGILDRVVLAKWAQDWWPWIKVIVTTGFAQSAAGRLLPNVRFLRKPWKTEVMLEHIRGTSADFELVQAAGHGR